MATVTVKKDEYQRLKRLDRSFGKLFDYFWKLHDISEARKEIRERKTISQERLFRRLGL